MSNHEKDAEVAKEQEGKCIEWLHDQLEELAGVDFTEEELGEALQTYLKTNNKSSLELTQLDKENIYADVLQAYLDEELC